MNKMRGLVTVEFAIIGAVLMMVLFACLEFGLLMFSFAALNEGTRRAARLAAVCPINDPAITAAVNFMGIGGFTNANVSVNYLDVTGNSLGATAALPNVQYVQVSVVGFAMPLAIPFVNLTVNSPLFAVTLPVESLGISNTGASTAC
jgi:Flp pilus assembly protein TadG